MTITIFPEPVEIIEEDGTFKMSSEILDRIRKPIVDVESYAAVLAKFSIILSRSNENEQIDGIGNEGYTLAVTHDHAAITCNTIVGAFYGIQTLRWLLPFGEPEAEVVEIPCCRIVDYPRFPYRGYMLDEARHFLGVETVKSVLDWMALLKLNRFHWHLTEDQGWRIEIKQYPKLVEVGSTRDSTPIYRNVRRPRGVENSDGIPHSGHYTQEQLKDVIRYASQRHITIIPEIEMPGHATAALASYPELRCILPDDVPPEGGNVLGRFLDGPNIKVSTRWGVHANLFCVGNPATMQFLKDVLREVAGLFPGPIIHIGGDEVPKTQWMCCERCQERMASHNLATEEDLQKAFTAEIVDYLATLGKITMLWSEHTDESLAKRKENVICHYWTGSLDKVNGFLENGGKILMSPSRSVYVDLAYSFLPLKKVFSFDPQGADALKDVSELAARNATDGGIIGVEAPMWGEVFQSKAQVEYCTFPRILAVSDLVWTRQENRQYGRFMERVRVALDILDALDINHASLAEADPSAETIEKARSNPGFGRYAHFEKLG